MNKASSFLIVLLLSPAFLFSQHLDSLTIEKIMRDPIWIGTSPSNVFWGSDSKTVYFDWNPEQNDADSLYKVRLENKELTPQKVNLRAARLARSERYGIWNKDRTKRLFVSGNTLYLREVLSHELKKLVQTTTRISDPKFILEDSKVVYRQGNNLYAVTLNGGALEQLTNFKSGKKEEDAELNGEEAFLKSDALDNSKVLRKRADREAKRNELKEKTEDTPKPIYLNHHYLTYLSVSPDGKTIVYQLSKGKGAKNTGVPNYVTQSGYTENIEGRSKVGASENVYESFILDLETQKVIEIDSKQIPGIRDIPTFYKDYPKVLDSLQKNPPLRSVSMSKPIWNAAGTDVFVTINAADHKDRWIMSLDLSSGHLELLDRQHDDAWIGGPGISNYGFDNSNVGWLDNETVWFHSEETGYSQLYAVNVKNKNKTALTKGEFEIQEAILAPDKQTFYITANKRSPGETDFYQLNLKNRKLTQITERDGSFKTVPAPDGKHFAILHSTSNHPWELFIQDNKVNAKPKQITYKAETPEFKSYPWRKPDIFTFTNRDGDEVYAEVYKPEKQAESRPGVIFVHGAGYLQDVKDAWSDSYFREHFFMNLLADHGYTVMNIDYRASAGYGRDWRTAIYRHMGKNDLNDNIDGAKYMVEHFNVNPQNIGIWGGSYGGFTTLMAMFTSDVFAAGGALRSVTDWAHYNGPYTSAILNLPQNDPIAYKQSSPIYFAEGLKGHLLMPHGMVDTNVHFQDIIRLTQKLIELEKDNWELAVYPVENHGFVEPSSWIDEYKRIFKLFEDNLK